MPELPELLLQAHLGRLDRDGFQMLDQVVGASHVLDRAQHGEEVPVLVLYLELRDCLLDEKLRLAFGDAGGHEEHVAVGAVEAGEQVLGPFCGGHDAGELVAWGDAQLAGLLGHVYKGCMAGGSECFDRCDEPFHRSKKISVLNIRGWSGDAIPNRFSLPASRFSLLPICLAATFASEMPCSAARE